MKLPDLLSAAGLEAAPELPAADITRVTEDSRAVIPGAVFVAVRGTRAEGSRFAGDAISRGAVAVVATGPRPADLAAGIPWIAVPDPRLALAALSSALFGHPARHLTMTGVTGSKGKTTTCFLVQAVAEAAGEPTALLTTVSYRTGLAERPASLTTASAAHVHELLAEAIQARMRGAVIEVSSHALDQSRVAGIPWACGIFTNLFPDHLDYHPTVDAYFEAKRRMFVGEDGAPACERAVVGVDGQHGLRLAAEHPRAVTFGAIAEADVRPISIEVSRQGTKVLASVPDGRQVILDSPLLGRFQAPNLLAAAAYAVARGFPLEAAREGVRAVERVRGRMEPVEMDQPFSVLVDYSHTGPALTAALQAVREWTSGRVIVVFGCGGNRDRARRQQMGEAAARLAHLAFLTDDNPRDEDPLEILREIERAYTAAGGKSATLISGREEAIARAIAEARPGDTVLIAGKGHETVQIAAGHTRPLDDRVQAGAALLARGFSR